MPLHPLEPLSAIEVEQRHWTALFRMIIKVGNWVG